MSTEESSRTGVADQVRAWLTGRMPDGWFEGPPEVFVDREEITVIGRLALPEASTGEEAAGEAGEAGGSGAEAGAPEEALIMGRARRFREETREARIVVAQEAERLYDRKVSWGVLCGGRKVMFTTFSAPVMTRLRQAERRVLDTLVDAGVARSRSDALAWCVRLVGQHEDSWLADLRTALSRVEEVREQGPRA